MRLIDADNLIEDIEKLNQELLKDLEYADTEVLKVTNKAQLYIICESVIPKIKEQPTAYDVDKVVVQLEKECIKHRLNTVENNFCGSPRIINESDYGISEGIMKAIEIVKAGVKNE